MPSHKMLQPTLQGFLKLGWSFRDNLIFIILIILSKSIIPISNESPNYISLSIYIHLYIANGPAHSAYCIYISVNKIF